jgi:hypothetical protein
MNKSASKLLLLASSLALASAFLLPVLRADDGPAVGGANAVSSPDSSAPATGMVGSPSTDAPVAKKKHKRKHKKKVSEQDGSGSAPADSAAAPAGDGAK